MSTGDMPRIGKGWNDPKGVIKDVLDSAEELPEWADDIGEVMSYVEEAWPTDNADLERLEAEVKLSDWHYCDICGEEYEVRAFQDERPAKFRQDANQRIKHTLDIYCLSHIEDGEYFSFSVSQYESG